MAGILPFPLPKRKVKKTIFPRRNPLIAPAQFKEVLEINQNNEEVVAIRNKNKDLVEGVLSDEEFESFKEAMKVKRALEVDSDFSKVLVNITSRNKTLTEEKNVRLFFLSEWERNDYINCLKRDGYIVNEIILKEEPKVEMFCFSSVYENYVDAKETLELLQKNYMKVGKIIFLEDGKYEVFISGVKEIKEKLYILEANISRVKEKKIYELEIKNYIKGYNLEKNIIQLANKFK